MPTKSGKPRFYSTGKHPRETAYSIMGMLSKHGAEKAQMQWNRGDDGQMQPAGVEFTMKAPVGDEIREVPVRLKPQVEGLRERLEKVSGSTASAEAVAWKQLEQLVEAQLEAAANGVRAFHEVFMSDILVEAEVGGTFQAVTMGELMERSQGGLPGGVRLLQPPEN